jgi:hypothetical protein
MASPTLKEKLIDKLKATNDPALLEEVSNLFELQEPESIYEVTPQQRKVIEETQEQVKQKQTIESASADKEADQWLSE